MKENQKVSGEEKTKQNTIHICDVSPVFIQRFNMLHLPQNNQYQGTLTFINNFCWPRHAGQPKTLSFPEPDWTKPKSGPGSGHVLKETFNGPVGD